MCVCVCGIMCGRRVPSAHIRTCVRVCVICIYANFVFKACGRERASAHDGNFYVPMCIEINIDCAEINFGSAWACACVRVRSPDAVTIEIIQLNEWTWFLSFGFGQSARSGAGALALW